MFNTAMILNPWSNTTSGTREALSDTYSKTCYLWGRYEAN